MHAKIVSCSSASVTAEVFDWRGKSVGTVTVPWDGEGWVNSGPINEDCENEALAGALYEIGEDARRQAMDEAIAEIEHSILDEFRRRAERQSDG